MANMLMRQLKAINKFLKSRNSFDGCLFVTTLVLGFISLTAAWSYCIHLAYTRGFWSKTCQVFSQTWPKVNGGIAVWWQPLSFPLLALFVFIIAFAVCLSLLRRFWTGIVVSAAIFIFGIWVYHTTEIAEPPNLAQSNDYAYDLALADNALSSFFMSRGDYGFKNGNEQRSNVEVKANESGIIKTCQTSSDTILEKLQDRSFRYYLFHALCYVYGAAFLCTVFGRRLVNIGWLWLLSHFWKRKLVVFWDAGPESRLAIRAEKNTGAKVVVVLRRNRPFSLKRERTPEEENLDNISVPWIYLPPESFSEAKWFSRREVKWLSVAIRHYWLGSDEQSNVETANELLTPLINPEAKFFIRIDADSEKDVLFGWADKQAALSGSASKPSSPEIILVHEPSLVAAKWIEKHPIHDLSGEVESKGVSLLVFGCGAVGRAIIRETVQMGLRPGKTLLATVVDKAESSFEPFRSFWNEMKRHAGAERESFCIGANFDFQVKDMADSDFWDVLLREKRAGQNDGMRPSNGWTRVIFALPDDLTNLRMAAEFMRQMRTRNLLEISPVHVFARIRNSGNADYAKHIFDNDHGQVSIFGDLDSVYSDISRRRDEEDAGARYLNWRYLNPNVPENIYTEEAGHMAWRSSSFFDKESTRSAVSGLKTLARRIGFEPCEAEIRESSFSGNKLAVIMDMILGRIGESEIQELAEIEHLRWCAFLLLRRIRPWCIEQKALSDLARSRNKGVAKGEERPVKENDLKTGLQHAALVPYKDLPKITKMFQDANEAVGIKYESKVATTDRAFVQSMGEVLSRTKWHFKPLATIGQIPPEEKQTP